MKYCQGQFESLILLTTRQQQWENSDLSTVNVGCLNLSHARGREGQGGGGAPGFQAPSHANLEASAQSGTALLLF